MTRPPKSDGAHVSGFTGRNWLISRVEAWFHGEKSARAFWLTGAPGSGRTSLGHVLSQRLPTAAAVDPERISSAGGAGFRRPLLSLSQELARSLSAYDAEVSADGRSEVLLRGEPADVFKRLLIDPLVEARAVKSPARLVILDGLDSGSDEFAAGLLESLPQLPRWLKFLVLAEKSPPEAGRGEDAFVEQHTLNCRENKEDVWAYLNRQGAAADFLEMDSVIQAGRANFLYAFFFGHESARGTWTDEDRAEPPEGLEGFYRRFFARAFPDLERYSAEVRPLLDLAVAAAEPLPLDLVSDLLGEASFNLVDCCQALEPLVLTENGMLSLAHDSFTAWLLSPEPAGDYGLDPEAGARRLADFGWEVQADPRQKAGPYFMRHLAGHLLEIRDYERLESLLTDLGYIESKCQAGLTDELILEYGAALSSAPKSGLLAEFAEFLLANGQALSAGPHRPGRLVQLAHNHPASDAAAVAARQAGPFLPPEARIMLKLPLSGRTGPQADEGLSSRLEESSADPARPGLALSADRRTAVTVDPKGSVNVWEVGSARMVRSLSTGPSPEPILSVAVSDDGLIVLAAMFRNLCLWDLARDRAWNLGRTGASFSSASLSGEAAVVLSADGALPFLEVWDSGGGKPVVRLEGTRPASAPPFNVTALSRDGRTAMAGAADGFVGIWDAAEPSPLVIGKFHQGPVAALAFSADGTRALSTGPDGRVVFFETGTGSEIERLDLEEPVKAAALSSDGKFFLAAGPNGGLGLRSSSDGEVIASEQIGFPIKSAALTGNLAAATGQAGRPEFFLITNFDQVSTLARRALDFTSSENSTKTFIACPFCAMSFRPDPELLEAFDARDPLRDESGPGPGFETFGAFPTQCPDCNQTLDLGQCLIIAENSFRPGPGLRARSWLNRLRRERRT